MCVAPSQQHGQQLAKQQQQQQRNRAEGLLETFSDISRFTTHSLFTKEFK